MAGGRPNMQRAGALDEPYLPSPPPPPPPRSKENICSSSASTFERHSSLPAGVLGRHKPFIEDEDDSHAYEYQDMIKSPPPSAQSPSPAISANNLSEKRGYEYQESLPPSVPHAVGPSTMERSGPVVKSHNAHGTSQTSISMRSARPSVITRQITFEFDESKLIGEPWYHGNLSREVRRKIRDGRISWEGSRDGKLKRKKRGRRDRD